MKKNYRQSTLSGDHNEILPIDVFKPQDYWKRLSLEDLHHYQTRIFQYYRQHGFPYYRFSLLEKQQIFKKFRSQPVIPIVDKRLRQTMHGLNLAWSYFPHMWSIRCNDLLTPMDVFNDDQLFKRAIKKLFQLDHPTSDSALRKVLRMFTGAQSVSNFRPTAARAIYEKYGENGVVWDMSAGFGGRLLGALSSTRVKTYIGTDPSTKTFQGLCAMRDDFKHIPKKILLYQQCSEEFHPKPDSLDLAFSSPPYYNTEQYSDESTQSYLKYPTQKLWHEQFLMVTIENCIEGLKNHGYLILNIANVPSYPTLCDDFLNSMKKYANMQYRETIDLELSHFVVNKRDDRTFKREPIFVFQKKN